MPRTLLSQLDRAAEARPRDPAFSFLDEGGEISASRTFGELRDEVRRVAASLRRETEPGDRALLVYPPGLDFVVAFLACSLARVVPVPAHPPHPRRRATLDAIVEDCRPSLLLTDSRGEDRAESFREGSEVLRDAPLLVSDEIARASERDARIEAPDPSWIEPSDLALLQYTSGSTGEPKGVMVRQDQLFHNESMIHRAFGMGEDSVVVSWLPVYHDMGLIGSVLQPIYAGVPCVLLSPVAFLRDPVLWLRAIQRFGGTTSGGPNFAYDLCVEKIGDEEKADLDLSSWKLAFSGAEPVRAATLERFASAFAPCGFDASAFYPCYGLAEATLFVAGGRPGGGASAGTFDAAELEQHHATPASVEPSRRLVGCGTAWLDQEIRIVDPETLQTLDPGRVGEIWVHGPSVAAGYWQRPEQTERDFRARPADSPDARTPGAGPFLRTGDLGFFHGGDLFVSGRLKDLVILRGRNLYPQDIERTAERSHDAFRSASSAAFSVEGEDAEASRGERLVLVMETERGSMPRTPEAVDELAAAVRSAVALDQQASVDTIVFARPGAVPKTSSGKIRRRATRAAFLDGSLAIVGRSDLGRGDEERADSVGDPEGVLDDTATPPPPPTRAELLALDPDERRRRLLDALVAEAASRLGVADSGRAGLAERPLTELGLDSLGAVEILGVLREAWQTPLEPVDLLAGTTLAEAVDASLDASLDDEPSIRPRARDAEPLPLSYGQEALFFLQDLAPQSAAYHVFAAASLRGSPDGEALARALDRLIERHAALRTRFHETDGDVRQSFDDPDRAAEPLLRSVDARSWPEAQLFEALAEEAHRPFDLRRDRLVRARLFRRDEPVLLLVLHHAIGDFWSLTVLLQELGTLYRAEIDGGPSGLPAPAVDYGDFVLHQRRRMEGAAGERLERFWRRTLDGPLEPLDLPTDRPRPDTPSFLGGVVTATLPPAFGRRLDDVARAAGTTLFAVLLAGFQAVLHRLSGQDRLFVGSPDAGRSDPATRDLVGYFVNPVVIESRVESRVENGTTWSEHLERVRATVLDALRHAEYPFELLVRRLQPQRVPGRSPIFQVMHTHQQPPRRGDQDLTAFALGREGRELVLGGLRLESLPIAERAAQMDLVLTTASLVDGGVAMKLSYDRELFDPATARGFLALLDDLLLAALDQPDAPLAALPLGRDERRVEALVGALGDGDAKEHRWPDRPADLFAAFRERAAEDPDAPALTFGEETLGYGELAARAAALSARLLDAGAGPEVPVALFVDRSVEMIVGLLGVLGAGAAWVPLDPDHPSERLALVLDEVFGWDASGSTPRLLATRSADRARLDALVGSLDPRLAGRFEIVEIDRVDGGSTSLDDFEPPGPLAAESLAYTIFTSGSTGRPKGVQIEHEAARNFLFSMARILGLDRRPGRERSGRGESLLAVTTLSFDISLLEIFLPLTTGARVVLADRETAADGARLAALLDAESISILQATPATWRLLLDAGWSGRPELVMLSGGEALPADLAERLLSRGRALWNVYGPTETTVWSAARRIDAVERPVRLGGALANTRLHVLDERLEPVPPGVAGELWIAGRGLARGYWRQPRRTAETFVPDPFAAELGAPAGGRLYRVGDRARRRADGTLEFLGRTDHQVKVRGYRIELGEIETVLARHPAVDQALVVLDRSGGPTGDRLVAFLLGSTVEGSTVESAEMRSLARAALPEYMVPAVYETLDAWPLNPNGKIDRAELTRRAAEARADAGSPGRTVRRPRGEVEETIAVLWCEVLGIESVGRDDNFFDLGGHSLLASRLHARLREALPGPAMDELTLVELFRHPTVGALAARLSGGETREGAREERASKRARRSTSGAIAIVGLAGRFPGADDVDALWRLLLDGEEAITHFPREALEGRVPAKLLDDPAYVRARGVLADADAFDASFFGYTPREAEVMDPQQRIFLECAWHAFEDAGIDPRRADADGGRTALFASAGMNTWLSHVGEDALMRAAGGYQAFISNDKDFLPTRVSYKLDLRGRSVNVQTACSSSLVAVTLACEALLSGEADRALAGGVTVRFPQEQGYLHEAGGILSADGHCRPFDADAGGTVLGSGAGVVLLEPLEVARREGRRVHAVIQGAAINNDGSAKMGYTAPSLDGQAAVLREALDRAGVDPRGVGYVEAHGTGTELGDPIEVAALGEAYGREPGEGNGDEAPTWLGSIKSNLGHLDTAAGVAGLIKAVLAVREGEIPPSLHFTKPNPRLDLGRFRVADRRVEWRSNGAPRRAAVSSFGIGGTNAHVILEEAPAESPAERSSEKPAEPALLVLSARTRDALDASTRRLAEHLEHSSDDRAPALADVAYTLQTGRHAFEHRRFLVVPADESRETTLTALANLDPARLTTGRPPTVAKGLQGASRAVAFLFSGQGSQYPGMAADLYAREPVFRAEVDRCAEILLRHDPELDPDLDPRDFLQPLAAGDDDESAMADRLRQTRVTQPVLFVVEWSLARWWASLGVEPTAMLGHSLGEWVAATLANVFSLEDALRLVALRGRLVQECPAGSMLAVQRPEAELLEWLEHGLDLAAVNGPNDTVLSGPDASIEEARAALEAEGVHCRRLETSHAFHSASLRPAADALAAAVSEQHASGRPLRAPETPFVSNVTGTWITDEEATDPEYWGRQVMAPVRFADGVSTLADASPVFLEVGPGRTLATLGKRVAGDQAFVSSLPHPRERDDEAGHRLRALGRLWTEGVEIDWRAGHRARAEAFGRGPRVVSLPGYPFERRRHFLPPATRDEASAAPGIVVDSLAVDPDPARWLYAPTWSQAPPLPPPASTAEETWVVYTAAGPIGGELVDALEAASSCRRVVRVVASTSEDEPAGSAYAVRPRDAESWARLFAKLDDGPDRVVFAPGVLSEEEDAASHQPSHQVLRPVVALVDGLRRVAPETPLDLVTFGAHRLPGDRGDSARPRAALLGAFLGAIERELPDLCRRAVDLPADSLLDPEARADLWLDLAAELAPPPTPAPDGRRFTEVALRHGARFSRDFKRLPEAPPENASTDASKDGSTDPPSFARLVDSLGDDAVLVTGAFGGVGSSFARALARAGVRRLALVSTRVPAESPEDDPARAALVRELEDLGAEVLCLGVDVADRAAVDAAVARTRRELGPIGGVIHAAGRAGGGLWDARTDEDLAAVLAPKIEGTENLARALCPAESEPGNDDERAPRFFVLTSSINAVVGGFGQSDYCAANAFQDAFATARDRRRGTRWLSLGWDRWRGVGMAAESGGGHPLLGPALPTGPGRQARRIHRRRLTADPEVGTPAWVLAEHRIAGRPTVPGAAYVEMARAAFAQTLDPATGDAPIEISDVHFLVPLATGDGEARETLTVLESEGESGERAFRVLSRRGLEPWKEHCRGSLRALPPGSRDAEPAEPVDLDALRRRVDEAISEAELRRKIDRGFLETGERWQALTEIFLRRDEAEGAGDEMLARLVLPQSVRHDLDAFGLHPALLDIGTGCVQLARDGDFLPLVYERLRWFAPLPAELWSHLRVRPSREGDEGPRDEVIHCDLDLLDDDGRILARVEGFAMRRIHEDVAAGLRRGDAGTPDPADELDAAPPVVGRSALADAAAVLEGSVDEASAHRVLARALDLGWTESPDARRPAAAAPFLVVSPRDLDAVRALYRRFDPAVVAVEIAESLATSAASQERPELDTEFVAPGGGLEAEIAAVWKSVLGIEQIGVHDNFFELGGTSLLGVQVIGELKKRLDREISTVSLFEAPTVAALAQYLAPETSDEPAFAATRSRAERKKAALGKRAKGRGRRPRPSRGKGR